MMDAKKTVAQLEELIEIMNDYERKYCYKGTVGLDFWGSSDGMVFIDKSAVEIVLDYYKGVAMYEKEA